MKKSFLILINLIFCCHVFGQGILLQKIRYKSNAVYAELGGNGALYSLNYERSFFSKRGIVNGSVGIGTTYLSTKKDRVSMLPIVQGIAFFGNPQRVKCFFGEVGIAITRIGKWKKGSSRPYGFFEPGDNGGITFSRNGLTILPHIGMRYQRPNGGFFAKCYLMYIPMSDEESEVMRNLVFSSDLLPDFTSMPKNGFASKIWGGISLGYSFQSKWTWKKKKN